MNIFKNKMLKLTLIGISLFSFYLSVFSIQPKELDMLGQSMLKYLFTHQLILAHPDSAVRELVQIRDQLLSHDSMNKLSYKAEVNHFITYQDEDYPALKKRKLNFGFRQYAAALYLDYGFEKAATEIMQYLKSSFCQEETDLKRKILLKPEVHADLLEWFGDALLEWKITQKLLEEEWPNVGSWRSALCSNLLIRLCAFPGKETMKDEVDKSTHSYGRDWEIKLGLKYFKKNTKVVEKKVHDYVEQVKLFARQTSASSSDKSKLLVHLNRKIMKCKKKIARTDL